MRAILLNPGPVSLSDGVRRAVTRVDLCHRETEFFDLQDQVISGLLEVYRCDATEWTAVLVGGSGTSALEAMVASLIPQDASLLVLENGVYGERLSKLASIYGISYKTLHLPWGDEQSTLMHWLNYCYQVKYRMSRQCIMKPLLAG